MHCWLSQLGTQCVPFPLLWFVCPPFEDSWKAVPEGTPLGEPGCGKGVDLGS